ncbi:hypothetical protein D8674_013513 [Pyrus ussuriensis x Pyrus communis]|uniref:Uncharacterized protein n=1 Tax=Pyrus ussuriensis x Pyrus communis TaxID=2448454 RepID=A0A5N5H3G6_9ROSA|nr:hypothetical protein D8674_013513 [Pyrus ussuriensis x Pyrus communis]
MSSNEDEIVALIASIDETSFKGKDKVLDDTNVSSSQELSNLYESLFDEMCVATLDNAEVVKKDDFPMADAIHFDDLVEQYRLYKYDLSAYHREAYADPCIPLVKVQISKSRLKPFYRIWSDFIRRNVLGISSNGNPTLDPSMLELDLYLRTTKDLHKNMMNLSNVMCAVAQGDPEPVPPSTASQDRKIAYLESEINSLRKQFVDFKSLVNQ